MTAQERERLSPRIAVSLITLHFPLFASRMLAFLLSTPQGLQQGKKEREREREREPAPALAGFI